MEKKEIKPANYIIFIAHARHFVLSTRKSTLRSTHTRKCASKSARARKSASKSELARKSASESAHAC